MRFLRDIPIGRKLTLIAMATSMAALLIACTTFVVFELLAFRATMTRDLAITAQMIGLNSASAITFDDPRDAQQTLHSLKAQPHIVAACLYAANGRVFATYVRQPGRKVAWPAPHGNSERFVPGALELSREIKVAGETVGTIYLVSDLDELTLRLERYAAILVIVILGAGLVAYGIASELKRVITKPVGHLAAIAAKVAAERNYSVRAVKLGNDELGRLVDAFNHMLAQIQARDAEVWSAYENVERRIKERTAELQREIVERTRAETALRESQQMYLSLVEHLPIFVYRKDARGRFVFANERFCHFKGRTLEQMLGKTVFDLAPTPEAAERFHAEDCEVLMSGNVLDTEESYEGADGAALHLQTIKVPVVDAEGRIVGTQGMFFDITARKTAEAERERMQRQLMETSRLAGMAEVATGVLHNVGNVLNSVNVSATLVADRVRRSRAGAIADVAALLREHAGDLPAFFATDARGRQVVGFLETLAGHLAKERAVVAEELESLRKNVDHIKGIVAMQQGYAKVSGVAEAVALVEVVEDALSLNAGALERHGVSAVRDYKARPTLTTQKHKVLQILVNLIRNAKYACDEAGREDKRVTVRVAVANGRATIAVADNGVGIPPENLTRIFSHGFTTRKDGHGFGLHSGALAAKELGGALTAHSDGAGKGATFTLELPLPANDRSPSPNPHTEAAAKLA